MCYGNIDPKLALRETEARMKGVSVFTKEHKEDAARPAFGAAGWLRAAMARLMRKDEAHV